MRWRPRLRPADPARGPYSAPPDPLAGKGAGAPREGGGKGGGGEELSPQTEILATALEGAINIAFSVRLRSVRRVNSE